MKIKAKFSPNKYPRYIIKISASGNRKGTNDTPKRISTLIESDNVLEKKAEDDPTNPDLKSSSEISCKLERLELLEWRIATNTPTEMATMHKIKVMINLALFSLNVLLTENLSPLIKEWLLYDLNI